MPPAYRAVDDSEPSASQTECLVECAEDAHVEIAVRFLHVQRRTVEAVSADTGERHEVPALRVGGTEFTAWTEAAEREERADLAIADLAGPGVEIPFHVARGKSAEDLTDSRGVRAGRLVHRWAALDGVIRVQAERVAGPYQALRLRVRLENHTRPDVPLAVRDDGL